MNFSLGLSPVTAIYQGAGRVWPIANISISSGSGYAGSVYTSTVADQWTADGVPISGETGTTFTMTAEHEGAAIRCGSSNVIEMWMPSDDSPDFGYRPDLDSTLTMSGANVAAMDAVAGPDLKQTAASSQPTLSSINGIQALYVNGTFLIGNSHNIAYESGMGSVIAQMTGPNRMARWSGNNSGSGTSWSGFASPVLSSYRASVGYNASFGASVPLTASPQILTTYAASGNADTVLRSNGGVDSGASDNTRSSVSTPYITIGGSQAIGTIGEFYWWESYDNTILMKLEGYYAHKYGLVANLPSTHPYKNTAPMVTS